MFRSGQIDGDTAMRLLSQATDVGSDGSDSSKTHGCPKTSPMDDDGNKDSKKRPHSDVGEPDADEDDRDLEAVSQSSLESFLILECCIVLILSLELRGPFDSFTYTIGLQFHLYGIGAE